MRVPEERRVTKNFQHPLLKSPRFITDDTAGTKGAFLLGKPGFPQSKYFFCAVDVVNGWEMVAITIPSEKRKPTLQEMEYVRTFFWDPTDIVILLSMGQRQIIHERPFTAYLWKKVDNKVVLPDFAYTEK